MNEYIVKLKEWWAELSIREKQSVTIGGGVLAFFLFYVLIWSPYLTRVATLRKQVAAQQRTLAWMQTASKEIKRLESESSDVKKPTSPVALLSYMQKMINSNGLDGSLTELKQADNDSVKMQFKQIDFDKFIALVLAAIKEQRISIVRLSAKADKMPGIVNAELMLKVI